MISLLAFLVVLGLLIFVHELGHFLFAKLFGVGVEVFSLGFGKKLVSWERGGTEYRISAVPLGGYVKMIGEGPDAEVEIEDQSRSFIHKHPLKRILIVVAGPGFNLLFAWLVYLLISLNGLPTLTSQVNVVPDMPAAQGGLQNKDQITAINGTAVKYWDQIAGAVAAAKGGELSITVRRGKDTLTLKITPRVTESTNLIGEKVKSPKIGVTPAGEEVLEKVSTTEAFTLASRHTFNVAKLTIVVFGKMMTGGIGLENVGGPIMIAVESGKQAAGGIVRLTAFMAALSVNLSVLNLLPIPILDGGHLVFYAWEALFRRPVSKRVREIGQQIGLVFLISLMTLAFYNDIARYWKNIIGFFTGLAP